MDEPQPRVVEVTRIVPAEDVPYVAARVAERLGMPVDRVRKLIEGRMGPITRPLRPDKAEAIAQTFEAAGVAVVIRAATEADDVVAAAPQVQEAQAEAVGPEATDDVVPERDHRSVEADDPDELEASVDDAESDEDEAEAYEEDGVGTAEGLDAREADAGVRVTDHARPADPVAAVDAVEAVEAFDPPDPEDWDDLEPLEADASDEFHGVVMEVEDARDEAVEPEPDRWSRSDVRLEAPEQERVTPVMLEPDDDLDETNDPGPHGLPARGEVRVRIEHDPEADAQWASEPGGVGLAGVRDVPFPAVGGPAVLADAPEGEPHVGRAPSGSGEGAPFGDPATWGGDDPSGGWIIGARTTRRFEVLHDEEPVSELPGAVADATDDADDATLAASDSTDDDAAAATSPPWRSQPGIGRAYRRPQDTASSPPASKIRVEHDAPVAEQEPVEGTVPEAVSVDDESEPDEVVPEGIAPRVVASGQGDPPAPPVAPLVPPPVRRAVPMPPMRPPAPGAVEAPATEEASEGASDARAVPTAWRGLGGDERGPARPVDARLPTRAERSFDERVRIADGERVTRRRSAMLIALAIALALFVVAQAWVAGRAAPAFDAGLHRFRDADFGAAQRVWVQLAEHGDANAQFMLGYLSEAGLGRPWSARAAAAWYRLAADAGHAEARWRLGLLYEIGLGVPHDTVDAMRWWAAAADAGHAEAAFRLGRARLEGGAGVSDVEGALAAFDRALALGWPAARPYRDALMIASSGGAHPGALP